MTLPASSIKQWSLAFIERLEFTLGDESDVEFDTYSTRVIFAGQERSISLLEIDNDPPLIGFKLLKSFHVEADMIEGGKVIVKPLDIGT